MLLLREAPLMLQWRLLLQLCSLVTDLDASRGQRHAPHALTDDVADRLHEVVFGTKRTEAEDQRATECTTHELIQLTIFVTVQIRVVVQHNGTSVVKTLTWQVGRFFQDGPRSRTCSARAPRSRGGACRACRCCAPAADRPAPPSDSASCRPTPGSTAACYPAAATRPNNDITERRVERVPVCPTLQIQEPETCCPAK